MRVEQAIYGEVRGGHSLRKTTGQDKIANEIASRLDLPDTAPPGIIWSPFLSGFPYKNQYIIARTFYDPSATRGGMVLTHALIIPLEEIASLVELKTLFELLIMTPKVPDPLISLEIEIPRKKSNIKVDFISVAEALVSRGKGPIIMTDPKWFEDTITALWSHIWPSLRSKFSFRLSFGPHDIVENPIPQIVYTPVSLTTRWMGYRVVNRSQTAEISPSAAILIGSENAEPVLRFAEDIGAKMDSFVDLPILKSAYEICSIPKPKFHQCVSALRLVQTLSPNINIGRKIKDELVNIICGQLENAKCSEVKLLRNLDLKGFPKGDTVWEKLNSWMTSNEFRQVDDEELLNIIDDALSSSTAIESWRNAIIDGVNYISKISKSSFPNAFWRWAHIRPVTLSKLFHHLPKDHDFEEMLSAAVPQRVEFKASEAVKNISLSNNWLYLHGTTLSASYSASDAVHLQLSVDKISSYLDGVRASLRNATPEVLFNIAVELNEPRISIIAGEVVAKKPQLLKDIKFRTESAQTIWGHALGIDPSLWMAPSNPEMAFIDILENLFIDKYVNVDLIIKLSRTPAANISKYSRCAEVWTHLTEPILSCVLETTVDGWLNEASSGNIITPDPYLESEIIKKIDSNNTLISLAKRDLKVLIRIISALPTFEESRFISWLAQFNSRHQFISLNDAESLGNLLLERHWQQGVEQLIQYVRHGQDDLRPALKICRGMIRPLTQWFLGLAEVSNDEKWMAIENIAVELYPHGPDENELWDRAGGLGADLRSYGSGRSRWQNAITLMRRGSGPKLIRLLNEMKRDYPGNEQVCYLEKNISITSW